MKRFALSPLLLLLVFAGASQFPPIPPLPAGSWPSADVAVPFARALVARVPPEVVAQKLLRDPESLPGILRNLGTALMSGDADIDRYAEAVARAAATKTDDVRQLVAIVIIDPLRYGEDAAFRKRIDAMLPKTFAGMPHAANVLDELNASAGLDFDTAEAIELAAHLARRSSSAQRVAFVRTKLEFPDDLAPIDASFFSLSSAFFTRDEATRFLAAVHEHSPRRRLIVLGDAAMKLDAPYVTFIDTHARPFTPWPRDPFLVARANGGVVFVNRPNVQPGREEDRNMVRALVDALPESARWTVAPTPFHNGNVLLTPTTVRISIHTVEPRVLAILGIDRVPAETFGDRAAAARYLRAVRQAADELHDFYRKPVRFVHSFDDLNRLGGGAGVDLDSVLTILPKTDGSAEALVGDLSIGAQLVRDAPAGEWRALQRAYGFRDDAQQQLADAQKNASALQQFLDDVAAELHRDGLRVQRVPLINVPAAFVARRELPSSFLLTWNNVVLEKRGSERRAEGFASGLASGDAVARRLFSAAGYRLDLDPPLIRSIELGGGFRCASNHLRR